jgi:integrin beta 3
MPLIDSAIARAALDLERRNADTIQRAVDLIPRPRDGIDGKDGAPGRDGISLDDVDLGTEGDRAFVLRLRAGEQIKTARLAIPALIDRGVYAIASAYEAGDGVTYGGDYWFAQRAAAPGESPGKSDAWRLAVRKGRDGRRGT